MSKKLHTIKMPNSLTKYMLYDTDHKKYCPVGYMVRHILNISRKDIINRVYKNKVRYNFTHLVIKKLHKKTKIKKKHFVELMNDSDFNNFNISKLSRIDIFKKFCKKHKIKLIE